jgi:hypothetical protein
MMPNNAWRLQLQSGELVEVRIAEGVDVLPGQGQQEVARAPGSSSVVVLDGDGQLEPQNIEVDFLAKGDRLGATLESQRTIAALRAQPRALWGAVDYEGLYLPISRAEALSRPLTLPYSQQRLPYSISPASVKQNSIYPGWSYPIIDDVLPDVAATASFVAESQPGAPILEFGSTSRWSVPVGFARMTQGTMFVGGKFDDSGVFNLGSVGSAVTGSGAVPAYGSGIYYRNGLYTGYVGTAFRNAPQDDAGGFGFLALFALVWEQGKTLRLYSVSRNGFRDHGSAALGEVEPLAMQRAYLGTRTDNVGTPGYLMPGAPMFGAPFLTHRAMPLAEIRAALLAEYAHHSSFTAFTAPPAPPSLALTVDTLPDLLVGGSGILGLRVERGGGLTGDPVWTLTPDDPGIRLGTVEQSDGDDNPDLYQVSVTVEEGTTIGPHTLTVRVVLGGFTAQGSVAFAVQSSAAALAEGALAYNPTADWVGRSHTAMARDALSSSGTKVWQLKGLCNWTSRWDGIFAGGETIAPWGASYAHIDNLLNIAQDHTSALIFQGPSTYATGALLFGMASQTNKSHYWFVYRAADGLKIRTSLGTATADSPQSLPAGTGPQHLAVTVDRAAGTMSLWDAQTGASISMAAPAWAGTGRLCVGALRQNDGTILAVSRVICLGHVSHQRVVSAVQLERQAEFMRGSILRTAAYARPEYPGKVTVIVEANAGEARRNRHPATAGTGDFMQSKGTASASGGSLLTDGSDEAVWYTNHLTNTDASRAQDVVIVAKDVTAASAGRVSFGVGAYDNLNMFAVVRTNGNTGTSRKLRLTAFNPGMTAVSADDANATAIPITGAHAYAVRLQPGSDRVQLLHIASGATVTAAMTTAYAWTGRLNVMLGGAYRGLDGTVLRNEKTTTGIEFEAPSETLGFVMAAAPLTTAEMNAISTNLSTEYNYANAVPDSGTPTTPTDPTEPTPPPPVQEGQLARLAPTADPDYSAIKLYPSGEQSTWASRWNTWISQSEANRGPYRIGQIKRVPLDCNFTKAQFDANQSKYRNTGAQFTYREGGKVLAMMCNATRGIRDPRAVAHLAAVANQLLSQIDWRGSARDLRKASWINASLTDYLGIPEGPIREGVFSGLYGSRHEFEPGIGSGFIMQAAYHLWMNRALNSSYAGISHRLRGFIKLHVWRDFDQYYERIGQLYASGSTTVRRYPERMRRGFIHADLSEQMALMYMALLESDMFANGATSAVSITLNGYDVRGWNTANSPREYGDMVERNVTHSLTLTPGTSANPSTHPDFQGAITAFNNWRNSGSLQLIAATNYRDAAMRTLYPDGAYTWSQGNRGTGETGVAGAQTNTYLSQTFNHLVHLDMGGVIKAALGTDAAVELFMQRIVAGFVIAEYPAAIRANKQSSRDILYSTTNSSGTRISGAYSGGWSVVGINGASGTNSTAMTLERNMTIMAYRDKTGELGKIANEYYATTITSTNTSGQTSNPSTAISKLTEISFKSGRAQ